MAEISAKVLENLGKEIADIDVRLDQSAGSVPAAKRVVVDRRIEKYKDEIDGSTTQIGGFFESEELAEDPDKFAAYVVGFKRFFSKYDDRLESWFNDHNDEVQAALVKLTPEEIAALTENRKEKLKMFRGLREILGMFAEDTSMIPEPKGRRGVRGKRGPRAISLFSWEVDGVRQPAEFDSLTAVADQNGYEKSKDLRDAIKADIVDENGDVVKKGYDLANPPDRIEFVMKNGKTLVGVKKAQDSEDDDDDDSDETEESEESEESTAI